MYGIEKLASDFHIPACEREFDVACVRIRSNA